MSEGGSGEGGRPTPSFFPFAVAVAAANDTPLALLHARTSEQNDEEHVNDYFAVAAAVATAEGSGGVVVVVVRLVL